MNGQLSNDPNMAHRAAALQRKLELLRDMGLGRLGELRSSLQQLSAQLDMTERSQVSDDLIPLIGLLGVIEADIRAKQP